MASEQQGQPRPRLAVPRDEARRRIEDQMHQAGRIPSEVSVNDNNEARLWYDFTEELLRQLFTTNELSDEFTGRGSASIGGGDISVRHYLEKLTSIHRRLELYPEPGIGDQKESRAEPLEKLHLLLSRFHRVTRRLRDRHDHRPTLDVVDEYDVQDLLHALLSIGFDDIRAEEWTPSYAGGSSRMDFLLKEEKIVVEVKKTRPKLGGAEIGEQLAVDMLRYEAHPDCKTMVCFIYDPEERITNPRGLERDMSKVRGNLNIKVYVVQK